MNDRKERDPDTTHGVEMLLGDPKSAIRSLSGPMIVAMLLVTLYNVADAFWVAGLGTEALAAIGFVFPFFFILLGISIGIGVGGASAVARALGGHDRKGAESAALHTILLGLAASVAVAVPLILTADTVFSLLGAGEATLPAVTYAVVIYLGAPVLFFQNVAASLFRGEGDSMRAMYAMGAASLLNIVLDPVFIYMLDMGVAGAAWATNVSLAAGAALLLWWMGVRRDTYLSYRFSGFKLSMKTLNEVIRVGIPASAEQVSMAVRTLLVNLIIVGVAGTAGVAVATVGFRVIGIAITPLIAISTAVIPVAGAAVGARRPEKLRIAHSYSVRTGCLIGVALAVLTYLFAPQIAALFTFAGDTSGLAGEIIVFQQIVCLFYPGVAFGMFSVALLQGAGHGYQALTITVMRAVFFNVLFAWVFAVPLGLGLAGVWWGFVAGDILGDLIGYIWARLYIRAFEKTCA